MRDDPAATSPADAHPSSRPDSPLGGEAQRRVDATTARSPFVPLLLSTLALTTWLALQTWSLADERKSLQAAIAAQQQTVDNAAKLRASLDALAADTQRLADGGNPNARLLVAELGRRGVTIRTDQPAPAADPAKK